MRLDAPGRRSVRLTHRNLDRVYFRAYALDLEAEVKAAKDYNLFPQGDEARRLVAERKPDAAWKADLAPTPDYRDHRTYANLPETLAPSLYLVVASAREDFAEAGNQTIGAGVIVGDLVLVKRENAGPVAGGARAEMDALVLSGATGRPVAGVTVDLYAYNWRRGHTKVESKTTDAEGRVFFAPTRAAAARSSSSPRRAATWSSTTSGFYLEGIAPRRRPGRARLHRPLHLPPRPEDLLEGPGLQGPHGPRPIRPRGQPGGLRPARGHQRRARGRSHRHDERLRHGRGEFVIPAAGRPLGAWQLRPRPTAKPRSASRSTSGRPSRSRSRTRKSPCASTGPPPSRARSATTSACPSRAAKRVWRVRREPVYPRWWWWWGDGGGSRSQKIAGGRGQARRRRHLRRRVHSDRRREEGRRRVGPDLPLHALGRRHRRGRRDPLRRALVPPRLRQRRGQGRIGGRVPDRGIQTQVHRVAHRSQRHAEGRQGRVARRPARPAGEDPPPRRPATSPSGRARPRTASIRRPRATSSGPAGRRWTPRPSYGCGRRARKRPRAPSITTPRARHDLASRARRRGLSPALRDQGRLRGRLQGQPRFPGRRRCQARLQLPLLLKAEKGVVPVGGTARILLDCGWSGQPVLFEMFKGGTLWERRWLEAGKDGGIVEIPVGEDMRGGFGVRLTAVRDHQFMSEEALVFVPWDNKELGRVVRDVPRQAHARRPRDLARHGQDSRREARRKGRGRAPGLHVRPQPRHLRAAPPAARSRLYPYRAGTEAWDPVLGTAEIMLSYGDGWDHIPGYSRSARTSSSPRRLRHRRAGAALQGGIVGGVLGGVRARPMRWSRPPRR